MSLQLILNVYDSMPYRVYIGICVNEIALNDAAILHQTFIKRIGATVAMVGMIVLSCTSYYKIIFLVYHDLDKIQWRSLRGTPAPSFGFLPN